MEIGKRWIYEKAKDDVKLAVGCTEPAAVGFLAAQARNCLRGEPRRAEILVSKNIFKNGKSVCIPGTKELGLELAAAIGFTRKHSGEGLMVFRGINPEEIAYAHDFLKKNTIELGIEKNCGDIYVQIKAENEENKVLLRIEDGHDRITRIEVNGEVKYGKEKNTETVSGEEIPNLAVHDLIEIAESLSEEEVLWAEEGIKYNLEAAKAGLEGNYGLGLGRHLGAMIEKCGAAAPISEAQMLTAAAADMRMGGGPCPIMTSGGSGNQGIGVILPIYVLAKYNNIPDLKRNRAIVLGHMVNEYIKIYSGKLSGMCGCAIGAGIGASAGITWMLGGSEEQVKAACSIMFSDLAGMLCDGAKDSCSLKLSTSSYHAVESAYLALSDMDLKPGIGILGRDLDETIRNVGFLCKNAFPAVDDRILELISKQSFACSSGDKGMNGSAS